jgi:RecB family exonuclease
VSDADLGSALHLSLAVARELAAWRTPALASEQIGHLLTFLNEHWRPVADGMPWSNRERRARAAIVQLLEATRAAHRSYHDPQWTADDLASAVRRWLGETTFESRASERRNTRDETVGPAVRLMSDQAARYCDVAHMSIVGLVESDWPEPARRNIFYPSDLLKALGWPAESDRRAGAEARFLDLVASATDRVWLYTVALEDDVLVSRTALLEEVGRAGLVVDRVVSTDRGPIMAAEALALDPVSLDLLSEEAKRWLALRLTRSSADAPRFHGSTGPRPPRAWAVSALETYLACPFKFFAQHVLRLEEDADDEEAMDPRREGLIAHEVFERFFRYWQSLGRAGITPALLDEARAIFAEIVDALLTALDPSEAALQRTRLLGSSAASGLGDAVFRMEAERPTPVVERLLEHRLDGDVEVLTPDGVRTIPIRGKADRIDLLADGTFRLIDYKLGAAPHRARALQLPIYGIRAETQLSRDRGRDWTLGEAVYLAFKGSKRVAPLFATSGASADADRAQVLDDARQRLAATVAAIERGEFPPTPDDVFRCETCQYASVCRKDHVGV